MALLLCFLFSSAPEIKLDLKEPLAHAAFKGRFRMVCPDGSFLVLNEVSAIHFGADGRFIRKLGRKGNGPGEFNFIYTGFWDGSFYYLTNTDRKVAIFDKSGGLVEATPASGYLQKIGHSGRSLYAFHLIPNPRPSPYLGMVELAGKDSIEKIDDLPHFHATSKEILKFNYNNENHWLAFSNHKLFVTDELTPEVHVYDPNYNHLQKIDLMLPEFAPSPSKWVSSKGTTQLQRLEWFMSWSRVVGFAVNQKGLLIAYEVAKEHDPQSTHTALVFTDFDGKPLTRVRKYDADFMGVHQGHYYLFLDIDDRVFPDYRVQVVAF